MDNTNIAQPASSKHYFATFIVFVAVLTMCGLGIWQVQRAQFKAQRLEQIEMHQGSAAISLQELLDVDGDRRDIPFIAQGYIHPNQYFLLDNRIEAGRVGYQVVVPMETDYGVLLVNFGFVPAGQYRQSLPQVDLPTGQVRLSGISSQATVNPMVNETASESAVFPVVIQAIDPTFLSHFVDAPIVDNIMLLDPQADSQFVRNWQPVVMSPEKHYAYAIQWFGLAIASFIIYFFAFIKRNAKHD